MGDFFDDLKYSLRMLIANPAFTITAIAALALGIGANTAIFTVVNTVLLKPLDYPEPGRLVQFLNIDPDGSSHFASPTNFFNWKDQTTVFQDVAAFDDAGPGFNLTGTVPELVHGIHVSRDYFALFGAQVVLGRTFNQQEDSPNGGKVVVISYGLWQRKFGGSPNITGTSISLGDESYTIVGVTGKSFVTDPAADVWLPFQFDPNTTNQGHYFLVAGRLKPGVTLDQANAQLKIAAAQFRRRYPNAVAALDPRGTFGVQLLRDHVVAGARSSLLVLLGAVGLVLLIACANVANLLLVRATGRKREFAIRAAMGASRARIIRQLLTESIALSMLGGALGLILGFAGVRALLAVSPGDIPRIGEHGAAVGIDWRVLCFSLGISLLTGVVFGLFPAIGASRPDLNSALKESSNRSGTGFRQSKARSLLVISEVSLALVLLIGAALLIRTFIALRHVNPGFNGHNVLTLEMSLIGNRYEKTAGVAQFSRDGRERLNAIPGVEGSAFACSLPLEAGYKLPFNIVGRPLGKNEFTGGAGWISASPGYFDVFKIPIIRGRDFSDRDVAGAPGVIIINQAMARKYWPNQNPIGQLIEISKGHGPQFDEPARQIIGIVGDTRVNELNVDPAPLMIVPLAQVTDGMTTLFAGISPMAWLVRTHGDPHQYIAAISEQLRQASGGFPVGRIRPMEQVMVQSTAREDFNMLLLTIFGASAMLLAAIGIYGLMAYSVQQRTQEMGIRMALGADRARIRNLVVWHGMRLALVGIVVGISAGFGLTRFLASLLYGVKSWDPLVFVTVPIVLGAVALLAVWLPASRAARLDPLQALRTE
jgi:predicted permease